MRYKPELYMELPWFVAGNLALHSFIIMKLSDLRVIQRPGLTLIQSHVSMLASEYPGMTERNNAFIDRAGLYWSQDA
jgi:hypothetical protein